MNWHALLVKSGYDVGKRQPREMTTADELRDELGSAHVIFPMQRVVEHLRKGKDRITRESERPLIRGYILATCAWPAHRHVLGTLRSGDAPYVIPPYQIARLLTACATPHVIGNPGKTYQLGDLINLSGFDHPLTFARYNAKGEIVAEFRMFGKTHEVVVDPDKVAA